MVDSSGSVVVGAGQSAICTSVSPCDLLGGWKNERFGKSVSGREVELERRYEWNV